MKLKKQNDTFTVNNVLEKVEFKRSSRHGPLLPPSIRCIICGPSNCGKTNLMFSLLTESNGLKFANVYLYSKSLEQPKYKLLIKILSGIPEIGCFAFENSGDVLSPSEARPDSVIVFDDVACDDQGSIRAYFSMGRHRGVDCFYLTQTYTRIPKHLLRDNANLIVLFKQDDINLKHVYDEHVGTADMSFNQFKELCALCWKKYRYGFVLISKDDDLNKGRYRCGIDTFISDI